MGAELGQTQLCLVHKLLLCWFPSVAVDIPQNTTFKSEFEEDAVFVKMWVELLLTQHNQLKLEYKF